MRPRPFDDHRPLLTKANELFLSGPALLTLMQAVLGRNLPFRFRARGWSMAPFIKDGDVITVCPFQGSPPGVGEVVAFVRPAMGTLVVHRVVTRRGQISFVQGDSAPEYADGSIPPENLLGRVTRIERNGHAVALGLGPERYAIAWLSRMKLLVPLCVRLVSWLKPLLRRRRCN